MRRQPQPRNSGFTLVELAWTGAVVAVMMVGVASTFGSIQRAFIETQTLSQLNLQAQRAMERITQVAQEAFTTDPGFALVEPETNVVLVASPVDPTYATPPNDTWQEQPTASEPQSDADGIILVSVDSDLAWKMEMDGMTDAVASSTEDALVADDSGAGGGEATTDPVLIGDVETTVNPAGHFSCMQFRLVQEVQQGTVIYDDTLKVFVMGSAEDAEQPVQGLVIGRGPDRETIYTIGHGPDGVLGTDDDDTETAYSGGVPANELLIPGKYTPEAGELFSLEVDPSSPRILVVTLRLNAKNHKDEFILPEDLVFRHKIALER